ncbi:hypothetical protein ASE89_14220 [Sphingomonas sp. Leaf30]|nr:hypothetical protein ASE89_14220 [Sphingomonas sp. Leaf30]
MLWRREFVFDQCFGDINGIMPGICLGFGLAGIMPTAPELTTTSDIRGHEYTAKIQERDQLALVVGCKRYAIGAISLDQQRITSIGGDVLTHHHSVRYRCSVPRRGGQRPNFVAARIKSARRLYQTRILDSVIR